MVICLAISAYASYTSLPINRCALLNHYYAIAIYMGVDNLYLFSNAFKGSDDNTQTKQANDIFRSQKSISFLPCVWDGDREGVVK